MHCTASRFRFCVLLTVFCIATTVEGQLDSQSNYRTNHDRGSNDFLTLTTEKSHKSLICMDIDPQRSLDMKQIMGKWYGNEIVMHTQGVPGVFRYDSCVVIQISDITDQMKDTYYNNDYRRIAPPDQYRPPQHHQYQDQHQSGQRQYGMQEQQPPRYPTRYLRLLWTERDDRVEYNFNYTADSLGRWTNVGEQRGSFVSLNRYTQFDGTVQVVKAVNDHLVLTFCGNDLKSSIYSIVLSRNPEGLSYKDLHSVRTLLSNRNLPIETIRKVCTSAAEGLTAAFKIILLLALASVFRIH